MSTVFYDHLVIREDIKVELDRHKLPPEERQELIDLADEILHHSVLNVILNHLPKDHHREFMTHFQAAPHNPQLMDYLKARVTVDIESEIKHHATKTKSAILSDIRKSKSPRSK